MKYCNVCVTPNTSPGLIFKGDTCLACLNHKEKLRVDWSARFKELEGLCSQHRKAKGYDCAIGVSGGKDSYFIVYLLKEKLGMHPLLINIDDCFTKTKAGIRNISNLSDVFDCDLIRFNVGIDFFRKAVRRGFEQNGEPLRFLEALLYTQTCVIAQKMGIGLVFFGEEAGYDFGRSEVSTPDASNVIKGCFARLNEPMWKDLYDDRYEMPDVRAICTGYYINWDGARHKDIAKRYGFTDLTHEWKREGNIEDYDQIDSIGYQTHMWMKYPKFGFARATDIASRWIRLGKITRSEALKLVAEKDPKLDQVVLDDFCKFCGYTKKEFWDIVERWWNRDIFEKVNDIWQLKTALS